MKGQENRLGTLLVRDGIVTQMELNHGLQIQKEQEDRQSLGAILVDLGFVTRRKLREAIKQYGKRVRFGEVLVENGTITGEQLDAALTRQQTTGRALGSVLVEMGVLSDNELARALGRQLDIPYTVPKLRLVDMKLFQRLPRRFIEVNSVIPFMESEGVVTVLVADPTNVPVIHELEDTFGTNLNLAICSKPQIDRAIQSLVRQDSFAADSAVGRPGDDGDTSIGPGLVIQGRKRPGVSEEELAVDIFDSLISDALEERASDIHIEPHRDRIRVRHRIDGVLLFRTEFPLSLASPISTRIKVLAKLDISAMSKQQEGRILAHVDGKEVDLRVTICNSLFGESIAIRIFSKDTGLMDIEDLGLMPATLSAYRGLVAQSSGLTVFVGPTGSGKTTSLYATLNYLNDGSRKIITVESPVEYPMNGTVQTNIPASRSNEVVPALSAALHQDPDVIVLGEVTSDETAGALLESGLMGHKVFSTHHAEDAANALVRLAHVPNAPAFLSSCALVIMAQRLVRKVCTHCSQVYIPSTEHMDRFKVGNFERDDFDFRAGVGCAECLGTGYRGRTGIFEMAAIGSDMYDFLMQKPTAHEIRRRLFKQDSFIPLRLVGLLKAMQGITTVEEVLRVEPAVEATAAAEHEVTLEDLCRRSGLSLDRHLERHTHDVVRTSPEE